MTSIASQTPKTKSTGSQRRSLLASTAGQLLEWYEWGAYAVFAPFIAAYIFDPDDRVAGLLSTFGVFAVGFLMRPLGGIVFGAIADRRGRKFVLITTMLSMAAASILIGLMPGHRAIGIWAAVILLLLRMVQGFAHGGESATANTYVAEIAPPQRRGMWGSLVYGSIFGGTIVAYALGGGITAALEESQVAEWGWRIPFLLGAVLALVALWLRRSMNESEVFSDEAVEAGVHLRDQGEPTSAIPVQALEGRNTGQLRNILLVIGLVTGLTAAHYTWSSYVSTYAIVQQGMDPQSAYWVTVLAQLVALIALPLWGRLSDRVGRKPLLVAFGVGMFVMQFPLMTLISDQPWTLFVSAAVGLVIVATMGSITSATMAEVFPTSHRTRNIGLAYSISVAVFGGSAPYLNQLFNSIDMGWLASAYIMLMCLVTLVSVRFLPETKGVDLSEV